MRACCVRAFATLNERRTTRGRNREGHTMNSIQPTRALANAIDAMCERNERTRGAVAGDVLMGERFVLVTLRRPVVVEGELVEAAAQTVDILDLMDDFARWAGGNNSSAY